MNTVLLAVLVRTDPYDTGGHRKCSLRRPVALWGVSGVGIGSRGVGLAMLARAGLHTTQLFLSDVMPAPACRMCSHLPPHVHDVGNMCLCTQCRRLARPAPDSPSSGCVRIRTTQGGTGSAAFASLRRHAITQGNLAFNIVRHLI